MTAKCKPRGPFRTGLLTRSTLSRLHWVLHGRLGQSALPTALRPATLAFIPQVFLQVVPAGESHLPVFLSTFLYQRPTPLHPYSTYRSGMAKPAPNYLLS